MGMTTIPEEDNSVAFGDPGWQWVPVADFPVEDGGSLVNGCRDS